MKAKSVGKNLDRAFSSPKSAPNSTNNIEAVDPPTIVNATGLDGGTPDVPLGVSPEDTEPKSSYHKNEMLESIFEKRSRQIAAEAGEPVKPEVTEDDAIKAPSGDEGAAPSSPAPEVPAELQAEEPPVASTPAMQAATPVQKYPVIVNGQRIEYTLEELQQQAQLGVAGRQNLEEAARLRKEAEAIVSSRQNFQPQANQPQTGNTNTPQLSDIPESELLDIAKRMNYGSEAEQVAALRQAIALGMQQGRTNTGPTPEQLINVATQNAITVMTTQQENQTIFNEYQDVLKEPSLAAAADFMAGQIHQKYLALGQNKSRLEVMREAGTEIRNKFLKPAVAAIQNQINSVVPQPVVVANGNKIERKRAAPQTPTSASTVASSSTDGTPNANPEAIALAMRKNAMTEILKARGQNVI